MDGHEFKVLRADRRRIDQLRVTSPAPVPPRAGDTRARLNDGSSATACGSPRSRARRRRWHSRPADCFPLALLGPAFLFLLWDDAVPRQAARLGFAWGAGLFLAGTWWIYTAIHDFGGAPAWMAALLLLVPVAVMGATTRCSAGSRRASIAGRGCCTACCCCPRAGR